jgi:hypothetical protein
MGDVRKDDMERIRIPLLDAACLSTGEHMMNPTQSIGSNMRDENDDNE